MKQETMFEGQRSTMPESIELTIASLLAYGATHRRWALAWSGGKDSTLLLALLLHLILTGKVPPPEELTILYADTRLELAPLAIAAAAIRAEVAELAEDFAALGCKLSVRVVLPPMDHRFFTYILGRGVPPPSNRFRWCTPKMKVEPMAAELERLAGESRDKILMLTGVRLGESTARDDRIALACGKDGAECGQGWYQETLAGELCDTLAPVLHWRVCHVWAYLRHHVANVPPYLGSTGLIAEAYGGDEAEESNARTGCTGCPVASEDHALARIVRMPGWEYLAPLTGLRRYYWGALRSPASRLRQPGGEKRRDGSLVKNQQRMGPLTLDARRAGLAFVLGLQAKVNADALRLARPAIDILNAEEEARILELIEAGTWPDGWDGDEPVGSEMSDVVFADGTVQPLLFRALDGD